MFVPRGTLFTFSSFFTTYPQKPVDNVDNFLLSCGYVLKFSTGGVDKYGSERALETVFAGNPEVRQ
ncbi:hypothetical protein [Coprothermobacter platensis]|uniref:hypothetical protein n=1 Tax=Coprothermobacter platensis TaxID=108819 RepID=UPI0012EABD10|nr:hypothetical protein [Coprothermobacter platensis]